MKKTDYLEAKLNILGTAVVDMLELLYDSKIKELSEPALKIAGEMYDTLETIAEKMISES